MIILKGQVVNTFLSPKGVNKDSGKEYGGQDKVQILGKVPLPNGEMKTELVTLTIDDKSSFDQYFGKKISVSIGIFSNGKNIQYYIPKGSLPKAE